MSLLTVLKEAIEERLFHVTNTIDAINMLSDGFIRLSAAVGTESEATQTTGYYFLSTARTPHSKYIRDMVLSQFTSTILVLDRRKLAATNRIDPLDYWSAPSSTWKYRYENDEAEDRITATSPTLPLSNISEIHVTIPHNEQWGPHRFNLGLGFVRQIVLAAHRSGIPIFVYDDHKDALFLRKERSLSTAELLALIKERTLPDDSEKDGYYRTRDEAPTYVKLALMMFSVDRYEYIPEKLRRRLYYRQDFYPQLSAEIHNSRRSKKPREREAIDQLVKLMRKKKITRLRELTDLMADRATELIDDYHVRTYGNP